MVNNQLWEYCLKLICGVIRGHFRRKKKKVKTKVVRSFDGSVIRCGNTLHRVASTRVLGIPRRGTTCFTVLPSSWQRAAPHCSNRSAPQARKSLWYLVLQAVTRMRKKVPSLSSNPPALRVRRRLWSLVLQNALRTPRDTHNWHKPPTHSHPLSSLITSAPASVSLRALPQQNQLQNNTAPPQPQQNQRPQLPSIPHSSPNDP